MNQGDLSAKETVFMQRPKSRADRSQSLQVTVKSRNGDGAKGGREVDELRRSRQYLNQRECLRAKELVELQRNGQG